MVMFPWNSRWRGLKRYHNIAQALVKYGYIDVVEALRLRKPLRLGQRLFGASERTEASKPQRLRQLCEELGPTFIKFGQLLSTRADLLPPAFLQELAMLQDRAPQEAFPVIQTIVEDELEQSLDDLFTKVEAQPLAAASMAQVHTATLPSGERVIIEV